MNFNKKEKNPIALRIKFFNNEKLVAKQDFRSNLYGHKAEELPNLINKQIQNKKITHAKFPVVIDGWENVPVNNDTIFLDYCHGDKNKFVRQCVGQILHMLDITKNKNEDRGRELG